MKYEELDRETFDAIVTGEIVHYACWLELEIENAIESFFDISPQKQELFRKLILQRIGLDFQNKIDILRLILMDGCFPEVYRRQWDGVLAEIEVLKFLRNALAHGKDVGGDGLNLKIGIINRRAKEKEVTISPAAHVERMDKNEKLLNDAQALVSLMQATKKL